jgi:hypothetical protein
MACGCQKNQAKQEASAAQRSQRAATTQEVKRASSSPALGTTTRQTVVQGGSQSFAMDRDAGRSQSFTSPLEERAARMRHAGSHPR